MQRLAQFFCPLSKWAALNFVMPMGFQEHLSASHIMASKESLEFSIDVILDGN